MLGRAGQALHGRGDVLFAPPSYARGVTTGLLVLVAALVAGTALGLAKRRHDGRFRPAAGPRPEPSGAAPTTGTVRPAHASASADPTPDRLTDSGPDPGPGSADPAASDALTPADLGGTLGERATLVQFSSAFCAPCRATRQVLRDVAAKERGVAYVEIDAESHLNLVRRLRVLRTPTVLVLDRAGQISTRASGQPRRHDVLAALGQVGGTTGAA